MLYTNLEIQYAQEVVYLFYKTFKESENESEAEIVSDLVRRYLKDFPRENLKAYTAIEDGHVIGCVFFSQLYFTEPNVKVFLLSPMAVKTDFQGFGIGQALINFAHFELIKDNVNLTLTYGDINFYSKVGYQQILESQIAAPLKLTYPGGWLANCLDGKTQMEIKGTPTCIPELNDASLW